MIPAIFKVITAVKFVKDIFTITTKQKWCMRTAKTYGSNVTLAESVDKYDVGIALGRKRRRALLGNFIRSPRIIQNWSVDYRVIDGSPSKESTWEKLSEILNETFESEDGIDRKINMLAIDSGFSTQEVYNWVRGQSSHNVMAIKGSDHSLVPLNAPTRVDVNYQGKKLKRSVKLWTIGVSIIKSEIYNLLKQSSKYGQESSGAATRCHFPEHSAEYFKQLTAEQLITKIVKGYPKREWQKIRDRNETLDCRVYARAAAIALGIDRSDRKWEYVIGVSENEEKTAEEPVSQSKPLKRKIVRSKWM